MQVPDGFKRCGCRDDGGGLLGARCPKLKRTNGQWSSSHGTWYGKVDIPVPAGRERVDLRAGGFAKQEEMKTWFAEAIALLSIPDSGPDGHESRMQIHAVIKRARKDRAALPNADDIRRRYTTGASFEPGSTAELLLNCLSWHEKAEDLKPSTLHRYRGHVHRLLVPVLGHIPREKLNADDIWKVMDAIDAENARIIKARKSDDPEVRTSVAGRRLAGVETKRRVLATLRSALGEAATSVPGRPRLLAHNPAAGIKIGKQSGTQKTARSRARLCTKAREEKWRADLEKRSEGLDKLHAYLAWKNTASRPSNVMIWRPEHLGLFLDHAEATGCTRFSA